MENLQFTFSPSLKYAFLTPHALETFKNAQKRKVNRLHAIFREFFMPCLGGTGEVKRKLHSYLLPIISNIAASRYHVRLLELMHSVLSGRYSRWWKTSLIILLHARTDNEMQRLFQGHSFRSFKSRKCIKDLQELSSSSSSLHRRKQMHKKNSPSFINFSSGRREVEASTLCSAPSISFSSGN